MKAYVSSSHQTNLKQGDILFFYASKTSQVIEPIGTTEDDVIEGGNIFYKSVMRPVKKGAGFQRRNTEQSGNGIVKQQLKNVREMSGLGLLNFDGPKVKDTVHRNIKLLV